MLKKILLAVAVVLVMFLIVVAARPADYHVERSLAVDAPAEVVYAYLDDLRAFSAWSPWSKFDPNMKQTFKGPVRGVGASYEWEGNDQVGKGRMTIEKAIPPKHVGTRLDFIKPFESVASSNFDLTPQGSGVMATWSMKGKNDFLGKMFGMFVDTDKLVGAEFEKGLAQLKLRAEAEARKVPPAAQAQPKAAEPSAPAAQAGPNNP